MKFCVFGDIHGNLEALKAAYKAAMTEGADRIFHLGDLGGYSPFVNEVAEFLIEHAIAGVQGNYDEAVANGLEHCGCRAENPVQERMAGLSFKWTKQKVSQKTLEYLKGLPREITFARYGRKTALFHATPHRNNLYWHEDRPEKFFLEMAEKVDADILVYGHTHRPYRKEIGGKLFINAGSVGKPGDGDPRACVLTMTIDEGGVVSSEFIRVPYDVGKAASAIIEHGLPSYFAEKLLVGL
jgi:putative phosphoesterase